MSNTVITNVKVGELTGSSYIKPFRVTYKQDGEAKSWDLVDVHESVSVIIYNTDKNCLVCVKQFRPGVYLNSIPKADRQNEIDTKKYPPKLGMAIEFCSGIVDKFITLRRIAADEIREETGYVIDPVSLLEVQTFRSSLGISGEINTLFYTEVTDSQKRYQGGGIGDEAIEVVELSLREAKEILVIPSPITSAEFLYGLTWFFKRMKQERHAGRHGERRVQQ